MKKIFCFPTKTVVAILLLTGLFYFNSCTKEVGPVVIPVVHQVNFETEIQPIFNGQCVGGCHNSSALAGDLDLSPGVAKTNIVDSVSFGYSPMKIVDRFHPENSVLWHKILNDDPGNYGLIMPSFQPYLSQYQLDIIKTWILQGAQ